ncbi:17781_t:CDS:2 [Cetraspora pellucida]|uniref:17781_t:CDS:1 n=1 Tax=Cetraspora pellucida TaxID=1433469 RepID=A0A9N9DV15_9GLOM|nr:17781_t:CDS:2 [Cetraspora pellucida]
MILLIVYFLLACLVWYYFFRSNPPRGLKKLPSPPGHRLYTGHFYQTRSDPHKRQENEFTEWAKSLGDIYSIHMGQQYWIILTSDKIAAELLQKRGGKYSSRPPNYYFYQVMSRSKGYIGSSYNERYRKLTPIMHGILGQRSVKERSDLVDMESRMLMQNLYKASMNTKDGFYPKKYIQLAALNIISLICVARRIDSIEDPSYQYFENFLKSHLEFVKVTNRLGDFFPILRWFSGSKFYNRVIEQRNILESFYGNFVKEVKDDKEKKPCAIRDLLRKVDEGVLDEHDVIHLTDNIFSAGTDTISASLTWIVAALANNPEVQSKAHQELDRVIGQSRLPNASDEPNIPYICAIIKEGQRYCGPTYLGVPHYIEEDDEYNGYYIPANSVVLLNIYGIHMDEKRYENPKEFRPERFLGLTERSAILANGNYENRDHFSFGAGRRLCIGIHLAELELLLGISRLLWCFRIENASPLGKDGKPIPINLDNARLGITVWPEEYCVKLVKRHDNVEKVLFDLSQ